METYKQSLCYNCIFNDSTIMYIVLNGVLCNKKHRTVKTLPMKKDECKEYIPYEKQKRISEMEHG